MVPRGRSWRGSGSTTCPICGRSRTCRGCWASICRRASAKRNRSPRCRLRRSTSRKMARSSKPAPKGIRLQKILSHAGVSSRRVAEELIRQGRVVVNGHVADELGTRADPARDDIRVDGRRLKLQGDRRYYLMYKPRGVVSTRSDPQNRLTIIEVLSKAGIRGY